MGCTLNGSCFWVDYLNNIPERIRLNESEGKRLSYDHAHEGFFELIFVSTTPEGSELRFRLIRKVLDIVHRVLYVVRLENSFSIVVSILQMFLQLCQHGSRVLPTEIVCEYCFCRR
jgi:hypothetical protein